MRVVTEQLDCRDKTHTDMVYLLGRHGWKGGSRSVWLVGIVENTFSIPAGTVLTKWRGKLILDTVNWELSIVVLFSLLWLIYKKLS